MLIWLLEWQGSGPRSRVRKGWKIGESAVSGGQMILKICQENFGQETLVLGPGPVWEGGTCPILGITGLQFSAGGHG